MARPCPTCGAHIPSSLESATLAAARCPTCHALHDLSRTGLVGGRSVPPIPVPRPEGWQVDDAGTTQVIRFRWFRTSKLLLLPFAIFWNGFLATAAFAVTEGFKHPERLIFGLLVPHVWVGVALGYVALANLINSTTVEISSRRVRVHAGPLPWLRNRLVDADDVVQPFVSEHRGRSTTYDLCAVMRDGRRQVLLRSLPELHHARFLERRIEEQLGIEDRPVEGELRRDVVA